MSVMGEEYHIPVLADECLSALKVKRGGIYFDGTLGGGNDSELILRAGGRLIAVDRDNEALDFVGARFASNPDFAGRYELVHDNFKNVAEILGGRSINDIDGALLDLGISSRQVDEPQRGFSYSKDGELDMRMDREQVLSAMQVVNEYSTEQLARIFFTYGEEKFARKIAANIVERRKKTPIETTMQLSDIIVASVPSRKSGHPAKKVFQALRIEVNNELSGLGEAVCDIVDKLKKGARLCVITFHSLEDRIVKQTFASLATDCICDKSLPVCVCGHRASVKLIGKAIRPSEKEQERNPRSKSATLRVAEKI